ncbi:peptidylprolyl isomerase [Ornithinibacillus xuwenensis]|uniref:peptidylprolyl isomerase n=1 Tax=Ornithinibacillus xuwenensis TaxID=3144668 RepID=A0ABU9XJ48_9BACI
MNKKYIYWIGGAVLLVVLIVAVFNIGDKESYVASINGKKISETELNELLVSQYGTDVLNSLITEKVIEEEIEKQDIEVTQEEIDAEKEEYYEYYGGEEAFLETLSYSGVSVEDFESDLELYIATNKLMEDDIAITEEEMETYFEENKDSFAQQEEVQASHILVEDLETANKIVEMLKAGEDFAELAKEYSTDSSAENGGELGYFGKGEMVEAFENAAFEMEVGNYSDPVETEHGYHVIKVTDHTEAKEAVYEDVKDEIADILFDQKADEIYTTWVNELMAEYEIESYL